MTDFVICDWPQCECGYDCERQDKHDDWVKEERRLSSPPDRIDLYAAELRKVMQMDDIERKFLVADDLGIREFVVTSQMIDAAMPELLKYEPGFSEPRERLAAIIGAALCARPHNHCP